MKATIKSLERSFETISDCDSKETFVSSLFQYLTFVISNRKISQIIKELEIKEAKCLKKFSTHELPFLEETEIWPHWNKIKPALLLSGKSHNEAGKAFLKNQSDSAIDFLHFRAGNNSFEGLDTNEQLKEYRLSTKILHNFILKELEEKDVKYNNSTPILVLPPKATWKDITIILLEDNFIKIFTVKFSKNDKFHLDKLGLITNTNNNKMALKKEGKLLMLLAMNNGNLLIDKTIGNFFNNRVKNPKNSISSLKSSLSKILKQKLGIQEEPFQLIKDRDDNFIGYKTLFKIRPQEKHSSAPFLENKITDKSDRYGDIKEHLKDMGL